MIRIGAALALAVLTSAALGQTTSPSQSKADVPKAPPIIGAGIDLLGIDKTADPCIDFYQYACGTWIKQNPIPEDQVRWVRSFSLLQERRLYGLRRELVRAAAKPATPLEKRYGDFFAACMNVEELEKKGLEPVKPTLERIDGLADPKGIAALMGELAAAGEPVELFALDVEPSPEDAEKSILSISPGGFRLPGNLVRLFMQAGDTIKQAISEEGAVVEIEKALARASSNDADSADPEKHYHVLPLSELQRLAPDFDFRIYLSHVTARPIETVNVTDPEYLKTVGELAKSLPIDSWKAYLRWQILTTQSAALPKRFRDGDLAFWDAQGRRQEPTPRWKQCATITGQTFGEALAQNWVKRNFTSVKKADAERLVGSLEKAFAQEIRTLPWMSDDTKRTAEGKLAALRNRIGHPQKWRDYSTLKVDRHDFLGDLHRSAVFERKYLLNKLGNRVDPDEWDMGSTTLAARYARSINTLTIPAGLIQPPFFDGADLAANFGGIGVLAAHELTHGFDRLGSKFDERGTVRDWWRPDDRKQFDGAASCDVTQVPGLDNAPANRPPPDSPIVAERTAGNGGLRIAYLALVSALAVQGAAMEREIDGYTERQRFFLSFAQISCGSEKARSTDGPKSAYPRPVGRVRVNTAVQSFEDFGSAFQCAKGQPMYPENACQVW